MATYQHIPDPAELAKTERALWEAHRLAKLQELMQLYPDKGWSLGMQSIDRALDGTPSPKQYTTALVAPIVDPDNALPGGLILVDQYVAALQGVAVDVKAGTGPVEKITIALSPVARAQLPAAWQAVLTKRETSAVGVAVATPSGSTALRMAEAGTAGAAAGASVATGLAAMGMGATTVALGGAAAALVVGAMSFLSGGEE